MSPNIALSTVEETYNFLIQDFDSAAAHLPDDIGLGRVSKPAAEAMLVRLHLAMGNWEKVIENANRVIENYSFQLEEEPLNIYAREGGEESSEVIWEYQWTIGHQFQRVGFITPIQSSFYNWIERRSFGFAGPAVTQIRTHPLSSFILKEMGWEDQNGNETVGARSDKRYQQVFHRAEAGSDNRLEAIVGNISQDHVWVFKDARTKEETNNGTDFSDNLYNPRAHVPLIRLSEIYLSRAIAHAKMGNSALALNDLNTIRERAWDTSFGSFEPFTTASTIEKAIEIERMRELMGEGDRLYYLKAMNQQVPDGDRNSFGLVNFDDPTLYWPMPPNEVDLNELVGNN